MKKMILSAVLLLASCFIYAASAQESQKSEFTPEQKAEFKAKKLANVLLLSDDSTQKFVPVYKAYRSELDAINEKYRLAKRGEELKGQTMSDSEVDAFIRNGFAKSKAILDIRIAYYDKFLKVLTPKQIKKMYEEERNAGDNAAHKRWEKRHQQHHPDDHHRR